MLCVLFFSCSGFVVSTCQVTGSKDSSEETSSKSRRLSSQRPHWRACYIVYIIIGCFLFIYQFNLWYSVFMLKEPLTPTKEPPNEPCHHCHLHQLVLKQMQNGLTLWSWLSRVVLGTWCQTVIRFLWWLC